MSEIQEGSNGCVVSWRRLHVVYTSIHAAEKESLRQISRKQHRAVLTESGTERFPVEEISSSSLSMKASAYDSPCVAKALDDAAEKRN